MLPWHRRCFEKLISSCAMLERLTLINFDGFTHLNINAPNLQFFDVEGVFDDVSFENTFVLALVSIGLYVNVKNDQNVSYGSSSKLLRFFVNLPMFEDLRFRATFLRLTQRNKLLWDQSELDCIKFLLSNSPVLEKMTIKPVSKEGGMGVGKTIAAFSASLDPSRSLSSGAITMDCVLGRHCCAVKCFPSILWLAGCTSSFIVQRCFYVRQLGCDCFDNVLC
ncbi:hypothetical protein NC651_006226 [Populus alba x Populus x berolinensis]|nr:hypothetical protein NC651_006226 [Populus alba x Populus x berolinensis]